LFIIGIGFFVLFPIGGANIFCKIAQATLLSLFIFGLFSYPSAILLLRVYTVLFVSMVACYSLPLTTVNINHSMIYSGVLLLLFSVCAPYAINRIKTYHNALQKWRQGAIFYHTEKYVQSINCFDAAFPALQTDGIFLVQYGKSLSLFSSGEQAITVLNKASQYFNNAILYTALGDCYKNLHQYQKAEDAYLMAYNMVPNRLYPIYLLAKLYHETGQSAKFEEMADRVIKNQPKVNSIAIDEMEAEIQQLKEN
jgi:tetratricopeptide (TPR) repeat protein